METFTCPCTVWFCHNGESERSAPFAWVAYCAELCVPTTLAPLYDVVLTFAFWAVNSYFNCVVRPRFMGRKPLRRRNG